MVARGQLGAQVGGPDRLGGGRGRRLPSDATSAGTAAAIRSTGRRCPMAPVEAVSTSSGATPSAAATAAATARSSTAPRGPVSALALPLLATMARIPIAGRRPAA